MLLMSECYLFPINDILKNTNFVLLQVLKDNVRMTRELARLCGQPLLRVENDIKRDFYLSASEAVGYGLIDEVRKPHQVRSHYFHSLFGASICHTIY